MESEKNKKLNEEQNTEQNTESTTELTNEEKKALKKAKRKRVRKIIGRVLLVILGIILVLCLIFHRLVFGAIKVLYGQAKVNQISKMEYREISLTKEQMLEDYDYLFDAAVNNSLNREYAEKYFKVDYDEMYETYKERVENCEDEYEFVSLMLSLDTKLPGIHSFVRPPMNDKLYETGFPGGEFVDDEILTVNYSLSKQFEEKMGVYDQKGIVTEYCDGDYILLKMVYSDFEPIEGLDYTRLVSLNGKPVKDVIKDLDVLSHWGYDVSTDSVYTKRIIFNDGIGEKYDAEIEFDDGKIIHKDLYVSAEYNLAYFYRSKLYPDTHKSPNEEDPNAKTYSIQTDKTRKLVYARFTECNEKENDQLKKDLKAALDSVDAEYVMLDFRDNPGGEYTYVTEGVLPVVMDHDGGVMNHSLIPKNKYTEAYYENGLYRHINKIKDDGKNVRLTEDFTVKGKAEKSYKLFAFFNHESCSSGDIFSYIVKQEGMTTIGQNSGGEGLSGHPLANYLPNSKLLFAFVPGIGEVYPEDNYLGVAPDYVVKKDWETIKNVKKLCPTMDGNEYGLLNNRMKWDPCVMKAIELMDEK